MDDEEKRCTNDRRCSWIEETPSIYGDEKLSNDANDTITEVSGGNLIDNDKRD